jgi:hypothetical protein
MTLLVWLQEPVHCPTVLILIIQTNSGEAKGGTESYKKGTVIGES